MLLLNININKIKIGVIKMENIEKKFGTAKVLLEMKDGKIVNFDIEGSDLNVVMCILNLQLSLLLI